MAIKINNTTVIDDSQNLCNVGTITANNFIGDGSQLTNAGPARVLKPTNTNPAANASSVTNTPTLCASAYRSLYGKSHANSHFQLSIDSGFSNTELDIFTGANTHLVVPTNLDFGTEYYFRVKYFDECGTSSQFSDATNFTTEALPDTLGQASFGGYYLGTICAASTCYYLILAPSATGQASCQYKTALTSSGVGTERCDGYGNTYDHLANADHPAGNWAATRSIGGFSDWYLPAMDELGQFYTNKACNPVGEEWPTGNPVRVWSSTEANAGSACRFIFDGGGSEPGSQGTDGKTDTRFFRVARRVAFP